MNVKNLILLVLQFTLLFPGQIFAQATNHDFTPGIKLQVPADNTRSYQEHLHSTGLHLSAGFFANRGAMSLMSDGADQKNKKLNYDIDENLGARGQEIREYNQAQCNAIASNLDQYIREANKLKGEDHIGNGKHSENETAKFFTRMEDGFAEYLTKNESTEGSFNLNPYEAINANLLRYLGTSIADACVSELYGDDGKFCSGRKPGQITDLCVDFLEKAIDPSKAADNNKNRSPLERIASMNATGFNVTAETLRKNDHRQRMNATDDSLFVANGNEQTIEFKDGTKKNCNIGDNGCYFTNSGVNTENQCDEYSCNIIGADAESVFGNQNSEIMEYLTTKANVRQKLNAIGDPSYCIKCLGDKFYAQHPGVAFGDKVIEARKAVEEKLREKAIKRVMLDHVNYLESINDIQAISKLVNGKESEVPANLKCESVIEKYKSGCGDQLVSTNPKALLEKVLKGLGATTPLANFTGESYMNALNNLSNQAAGGSCDNGPSGREKFAIDKFYAWNNDKVSHKESLDKLIHAFVSIDGVNKSDFHTDLSEICNGEANSLKASQSPVEFLSQSTADFIQTYERSGVSCDEAKANDESQRKIGFVSSSIFKKAMCDKGFELGRAYEDVELNGAQWQDYINALPVNKRPNGNQSKRDELKKHFIAKKTKDLLTTGLDMDPRYNLAIGSWDNLCQTYKKANPGAGKEGVTFNETLAELEGDKLKDISASLATLAQERCDKLDTSLGNLVCSDNFIDDEGSVGKLGGVVPFNAEDLAKTVRDIADEYEDDDPRLLALSSYSCSTRSKMLIDADDPYEEVLEGSKKPIIDSEYNRNGSEISDLEQTLSDLVPKDITRPFIDDSNYSCEHETNCFKMEKVSSILGVKKYSQVGSLLRLNKPESKCNYQDAVDDIIVQTNSDIANNSTGGSGRRSSGSTRSSGNTDNVSDDFYKRAMDNMNNSSNDTANRTATTNRSGTTGFSGGSGAAFGSTGSVGTTPDGFTSAATYGTEVAGDSTTSGEVQNLLGGNAFYSGTTGNMGAMNGVDNSQTQMNQNGIQMMNVVDTNSVNTGDGASRSIASIADVGGKEKLDFASMSDEELKAYSERMGIDMKELLKNSSKKSDELDEDSALAKLISSMEDQQKSSKEIIEELRKQNENLSKRLTAIEGNASLATVKNVKDEIVTNIKPTEAFKSPSYVYDAEKNSFQPRSTITTEDKASFSPDFSGGSDSKFAASNFSSYSDSRRSAIRTSDSEINKEFLTLIAGESGSYDGVKTSKENVEQYVDFVSQKGSIVHLVRYDAQGNPVSIKVPWSDEEVALEGDLAALKDKIPAKDLALLREESDYIKYKTSGLDTLNDTALSLQAFFATEASEQIQLSSLIQELESVEQ